MGFTNVAWESRGTEQLARDLTDGPGPMSVGQAGAAWERVARELVSVSEEFGAVAERIKGSFAGQGADAAMRRLDEFIRWLQALSLSAAGNGQRAEEAVVANSVAVLAMPSVSEAVEARAVHDVMASLAAYNGAVLDGQFAQFDEAASTGQATASAVMYQYEQACDALAAPWEQPPSPDVTNGAALAAERNAQVAGEGETDGRGAGVAAGGPGVAPVPLAAFRAREVKSSGRPKALDKVGSAGGTTGTNAMGGGGYGPMGALGRGGANRDHESSGQSVVLDGAGESGAGISEAGGSWLPAAQQSDAPFVVTEVSWGPSTAVFDELAGTEGLDAMPYGDEPERTLEQVSNQWVAPPVIGIDKELML